jgi:hypothetical protein
MLFLFLIACSSSLISSKLEKNNIKLFAEFKPFIIFFLFFVFFSFAFNFLLIFDKFNYFRSFFYIVIFFLVLLIILNKNYFKTFLNTYQSKKFNLNEKLILSVLFIFYLIAILPISDADSLSSHQYFASYAFLNGLSDLNINRLVEFTSFANSEILLIFSPILKSDNFGAQLNLISLLILFILNLKKNNSLFLFLVSCPLIIFFISTQKLQLFFSILFLVLFIAVHKKMVKSKLEIFIFLLLLSFYSSGKLSYILISGPLFIYFLFRQKKDYKFIFINSLICFLLTLLPIFLIKYNYFGNPVAPFFDDIFNKGRPIMESLALSLRSSEGWLLNSGDLKIYIKPFIPTSLGSLSSSLGILFFFLLFNFSLLRKLNYYPIIIILLIIFTGQILPRYYFEAFLILAFFYELKNYRLVKFLIYSQASLILIFSLSFIFISYYSEKVFFDKEKYMNRFSYSFFNSKEYDKLNISKNILVTSQGRTSLFIKDNIYANRLINNMNLLNNNKLKNLINYINNNSIEYIISNSIEDLPKCLSVNKVDEIYTKKSIRNFLVKGNTKNKKKVFKIIKNECNA